jgi:hypothetical protein
VDEFTAVAKGWRYWSDGTSLLPYCPECATREFAPDAPANGRVPPRGGNRNLLAAQNDKDNDLACDRRSLPCS